MPEQFDISPFIRLYEWPYRALSTRERDLARPITNRVRDLALQLLGEALQVDLESEGKHLIIMSRQFMENRLYQGADVVIERSERKGAKPEFSYAFYPDRVINRPNLWLYIKKEGTEGESDMELLKATDDFGRENYEVGKEELEKLLDRLEKSTFKESHY